MAEEIVERFLPDLDSPLVEEADDEAIDDRWQDADDLVVAAEPPPPVGRTWAYDYVAGRMLSRGRGPVEVRGIATIKQWVEKCLRTDRGAHAIHPDEYGVEDPFEPVGFALDSADMADYFDRVHDALTFHPRIVDVRDFELDSDSDEEILEVRFTIVLDDYVEFGMEVGLG